MDQKTYREMYQQSIQEPEQFWAEQAKKYCYWFRPWDQVLTGSLAEYNVRWFNGAKINACYNCLDRHLPEKSQQAAIIWEGNEDHQSITITYAELFIQVCRLANALKSLGVKKGDRVCIYLPMIPEAAIAMLACARIGAIHSVVFAGFSAMALKQRIVDAQCKILITADESLRGDKKIPLKIFADEAVKNCECIQHVLVVKNTGVAISWNHQKDIWYDQLTATMSEVCAVEECEANDPLFILYTSGSTGNPKGILHGTGGYLVYTTMSFKIVFNYTEGDIFWCSADIGWITGHSYLIYGPLANGATTLMFAGIPTYPTASRYWQVIDKHRVNIFYTAPTAIRALMREGDAAVTATSRKSLKILGTVGEPINPQTWQWYYSVVGENRCPIVDTWWQTETGGIMLTPLPGITDLKPGSVAWPFFGIAPAIIHEQENSCPTASGQLVITKPWPSMLQTLYGDHQRFIETYFSKYPGNYFTGDGASCDKNGYYTITGRMDDVMNIAGHRLSTAEIESALVAHPNIAEAAVVDFPHKIKGQGIYAFITLMNGISPSRDLKQEIIQWVRDVIGPIATPDIIQWSNELPKTRSGKIMRRILRKIAHQQIQDLGDISTLANPQVVEILIREREEGRG